MNAVFVLMLLAGIAVETVTKGGDAALSSLLNGATEAVTLCISLSGGYLFWMGVLGIVEKSGLMTKISRLLSPVIAFLFPGAGRAAGAIAMNLSANMLGMGNAATPFGIEAMKLLEEDNPQKGTATHDMCALLIINASCLELLPAGQIALRQACGSLSPASIVIPTFLSSAAATAAAVVLCLLLRREKP